MGLFTKPEYRELMLPFEYVESDVDSEAGIISIEAYGNVFGENKYCYACYNFTKGIMYDNGDYEQIIEMLRNCAGKTVKVIFKFKKDKLKSFKIDLNSLCEAYNDERFMFMELNGWGLNDKSFEELEADYKKRRDDEK